MIDEFKEPNISEGNRLSRSNTLRQQNLYGEDSLLRATIQENESKIQEQEHTANELTKVIERMTNEEELLHPQVWNLSEQLSKAKMQRSARVP